MSKKYGKLVIVMSKLTAKLVGIVGNLADIRKRI